LITVPFQESYDSLLDTNHRFFLISLTSLNSSKEFVDNLQGSQNLSFIIRPIVQNTSNQGLKKCGLDLYGGINILHLKPQGLATDSLDLRSLLFPEAGNFGFMIAPILHWKITQTKNVIHRFSTELSYSFRQNKLKNSLQYDSLGNPLSESLDLNFTTITWNIIPVRYNMKYSPNKDLVVDFNLAPYFNLLNIPNEDVNTFNRIFPKENPVFEPDERSFISGIGLKMSCSINGFMLFADVRQNFNVKKYESNTGLTGMIFNVGFAQNLNIISK
jgi:hypothetical protein